MNRLNQRNLSSPDHRIGVLAVIICVLLMGLTARVQADDGEFVLSRLSVADELQDIQTEDLNADGLKDILVLHRKGLAPDETRWVSIFWQRADGGFSTAADQSWELDTAATVLDIGDVAGDSGKEICYLTAGEVRYYPLTAGAYGIESVPLLSAKALTVFPSRRRVPLINFVRDWNDDGADDIGIPGFRGLSIYSRDRQGTFSAENKLLVELHTGVSRVSAEDQDDFTAGLSAQFTFPDIRLIDYDSDGRKDLLTVTEDRVIVYRHNEDGRFSEQAAQNVFFDVRTQQEKIEGKGEIETVVNDLDNDGYADAVVIKQTSQGLSNFRGVMNLFWGKPEGYSATPDQVIISEGTASAQLLIRDVNGDGRKDLILPSYKISITSIIRWLITRKIPVNFNIFLLQENHRYPERPDFTKEVKFKIDWSGESDTQAMDLDGDYNGDNYKDFVFATAEDELSIYLGDPEGGDRLFSRKPAARVTADAFGRLSSPDLNGDGYSDMIIYYPQSKERKGIVEVLINQGKIK